MITLTEQDGVHVLYHAFLMKHCREFTFTDGSSTWGVVAHVLAAIALLDRQQENVITISIISASLAATDDGAKRR